jgi:prepilin-type N-terminal cleavage/methylation domain-containing protein
MINKLQNKRGFSLVEIILAVSIFALCVTGLTGALIYGQQSGLIASHRAQAIFLANEGIEATQNIASENFSNLEDGIFGLVISNNTYVFSGSSDTWDIYERNITISSINDNTKKIESNVTWSQGYIDEGESLLTTYITNWK